MKTKKKKKRKDNIIISSQLGHCNDIDPQKKTSKWMRCVVSLVLWMPRRVVLLLIHEHGQVPFIIPGMGRDMWVMACTMYDEWST